MKKLWTITILCLTTIISSQAQVLKGKIVDEKSKPIPYATIYVVETHTGAVTNDKGEFCKKLYENRLLPH